MSTISITQPKPPIKWVGGKSSLLTEIIAKIPVNVNTYYEPFVGGGSVFIELLYYCYLKKYTVKNFKISDVNGNLINMYKQIQNNVNALIQGLTTLANIYNNLSQIKEVRNSKRFSVNSLDLCINISNCNSKEHLYYVIRELFNKTGNTSTNSLDKAIHFIFLNKTGFRGLYRESKSGVYNVPFGNYPSLNVDDTNLRILNWLFNNNKVEFIQESFDQALLTATIGDFVYMDPPYAPIDNTSFTSYSSDDFGLEANQRLFTVISNLNCNFLLSNADVDYIRQTYENYPMDVITVRRAINSKNPASVADEVLIYN